MLGALAVMAGGGACGSTTGGPGAAGAGGGGNGGQAGAAGQGGSGGQSGAAGGTADAGGCRAQGQTCSDTQSCCGALICAGICTQIVGQSPDAARDATLDAQDASPDADPFGCAAVRPLVLSDPKVVSGTIAAGQTVTMQITLTDTDPNGFVSYPGAFLTSSTPGVTFSPAEAGPPGAYINGTRSEPITFDVKLAATVPSGTEVQISARAYGSGGPSRPCNGFVLSFSITTT
jgi:hypothetical protein